MFKPFYLQTNIVGFLCKRFNFGLNLNWIYNSLTTKTKTTWQDKQQINLHTKNIVNYSFKENKTKILRTLGKQNCY